MKKFPKAKAEAARNDLLYILRHGNKDMRTRVKKLLARAAIKDMRKQSGKGGRR
jgi:hypothetical protein